MITRRIFAGIGAALLLIAAGTAQANDKERQKLFIELYKVMRYDNILAQTTNAVGASMEAALRQKFPQIDRKSLDIVREVAEETFASLKPQMIQFTGTFMVDNFNEGDIRNMIGFYKTQTGQKTLTLMPKMTQEMMAWLMPTMQSLQLQMRTKLRERLKPRGYDL